MMIKEHDKEYELFQINKTVSFDEFTLNKNHIKGEILLTHDKYHGSMLIKECNSKVTLQFIQSFPKINYYKNQTIAETTKINEKLDGSCICIYRLCDENGEFLEHVPKTRQKAVLNKHIQEMYQLCQIQNKFRKDISIESIFFEMYGMLNLHTIRHYKTYINLALIGAYDGNNFLNNQELTELSNKIKVDQPSCLGSLTHKNNDYNLKIDDDYNQLKINHTTDSMDQIIIKINEYLDLVNELSQEEIGTIKFEGVVLHNNREYIKIKPESYFTISGRPVLNISRQEIKKEIHKIFEEKSELLIEECDENNIITEINVNLEEEYDRQDVYHPKVQKLILKQLYKYIESLPDKNLNKIVNNLIELNPNLSTKEYMKLFAKENPLLKHKSNLVYNMILRKI